MVLNGSSSAFAIARKQLGTIVLHCVDGDVEHAKHELRGSPRHRPQAVDHVVQIVMTQTGEIDATISYQIDAVLRP